MYYKSLSRLITLQKVRLRNGCQLSTLSVQQIYSKNGMSCAVFFFLFFYLTMKTRSSAWSLHKWHQNAKLKKNICIPGPWLLPISVVWFSLVRIFKKCQKIMWFSLMALGYQWSKSLEFGSCIFLQDLNNLHKPRTGCNSEYSKNGCQKSISSLGTSAPTARGFYLNSVKKCKHSSTYVL